MIATLRIGHLNWYAVEVGSGAIPEDGLVLNEACFPKAMQVHRITHRKCKAFSFGNIVGMLSEPKEISCA